MEDEQYVFVETTLVRSADAPEGWVQDLESPSAYAYLPTSNEAILATNDLLARGESLSRATEPFQDSGREFGTGTFIISADEVLANELARRYALQVFALQAVPDEVSPMQQPRLLVNGSEGTTWFLDTYGFDFDTFSESLAGADLSGYDIFLCQSGLSSGQAIAATLKEYFDDGGDYIGIGRNGADVSARFDLSPGVTYDSDSGNGIVRITYDPADPVSAQYPADSYAFVYSPTFFENDGDLDVSASIQGEEFFVSGYWVGWENSGAAGQPIVLHGVTGSSNVTLIGIDPTFRAHPEHTFRILANAIYSSLD
jgi:hypothetical protein